VELISCHGASFAAALIEPNFAGMLDPMPDIQVLTNAVKAADDWIDDLQRHLGWHDRERVYRAMLAALNALRDSLPRDEVVYIGAQMRPLLSGLCYEGWHPGAHTAAHSRTAFLQRFMTRSIARRASIRNRSRRRVRHAQRSFACGGRGLQGRDAKVSAQPVAEPTARPLCL
jgi:uncharacterized protein (DUF2267 family)